jgi:hypothetical protein
VGRDQQLDQPLLPGRRQAFEVARQRGREGGLRLPLRVLRRQGLDPVDGEEELEIDGLLGPQRAVVVEGGDALGGGHEVRAALPGDPGDEVEDGLPGRPVVPAGQGRALLRICRAPTHERYRRDGQRAEQESANLVISPLHRRPPPLASLETADPAARGPRHIQVVPDRACRWITADRG